MENLQKYVIRPFEEYFLKIVKKHYADFKGKAQRKEYWLFVLIYFIAFLLLEVIVMIIESIIGRGALAFSVLLWLCSIALLVPSLALTTRRLHDTNRSGWWQLIVYIPGVLLSIASIILLFIFAVFYQGAFYDQVSGDAGIITLISAITVVLAVVSFIGLIVLIIFLAMPSKSPTRFDADAIIK
ncbi:MAG: DUF805 domain-containing protein [Elusimicrobiota bacterium]|jgi:uncharacterized membrane protein YhaH (DUF805 family)|nr:DUF805 domain-containing protein [Elusimicrobiota bacterium]